MLDNKRAFDWKVALLRGILYDDILKYHIIFLNGKYRDNYFVMNSMEQMSKIFQYRATIKDGNYPFSITIK